MFMWAFRPLVDAGEQKRDIFVKLLVLLAGAHGCAQCDGIRVHFPASERTSCAGFKNIRAIVVSPHNQGLSILGSFFDS